MAYDFLKNNNIIIELNAVPSNYGVLLDSNGVEYLIRDMEMVQYRPRILYSHDPNDIPPIVRVIQRVNNK